MSTEIKQPAVLSRFLLFIGAVSMVLSFDSRHSQDAARGQRLLRWLKRMPSFLRSGFSCTRIRVLIHHAHSGLLLG